VQNCVRDTPATQGKTSMQVNISSDGVSVRGLPESGSASATSAVEIITNAVVQASVSEVSSGELSNRFFGDTYVYQNRINNGVVETPKFVASYITRYALRRWCARNEEPEDSLPHLAKLRWLDPCSGGGVFPCAILEHYIVELGANEISELPHLCLVELSPLGITVSLCNIKKLLERHNLCFEEFVESKRITVLCGDFLELSAHTPELFNDCLEADLVVGNPPYVRSTRLTRDYKDKLNSLFPTVFTGGSDLYAYFIAGGVNTLKSGGVLGYISPAAFSRAKNGQALRRWLKKNIVLDTFIDLDESQVFSDADLHAAIYILAKQSPQSSDVKYLLISNRNELIRMCEADLETKNNIFDLEADGWSFHPSKRKYTEFYKLFSNTISLEELGINIYSGIRPGFKKAYIIKRGDYLNFSASMRAKWFKPIVLPSKMERWKSGETGDYMLVIPSGTTELNDELLEHLFPFKDRLAARPEVRNKDLWYCLRSCSYYKQMEERKIAFPDLSAKQRFSIINRGTYVLDGSYFADTDDLVLLAVLNSNVGREYFQKRCSSVGNLTTKGRFRFKKTFVQEFKVPPNLLEPGDLQSEIRSRTEEILLQGETNERVNILDDLVFHLYGRKNVKTIS